MTDTIIAPEEEAPRPRSRAAKNTEPTVPKDINAIIPLIRAELGAVEKDQESQVGTKYKYRGHDQIVNAIVPLFNKYGVYTTVEDTSLYYEGRNAGNKYATASLLRKAVTFWAPDGTSRTSTIVAESVDYGNKATGQAATYAYRIALEQTFTIPTGQPDPDAEAPDLEPTAAPAPATPTVPAQPQAVAPTAGELDALRGSIKEHLKEHGIEGKDPVLAAGKAFFNGREGFWDNRTALTRWETALKAGEVPESAN